MDQEEIYRALMIVLGGYGYINSNIQAKLDEAVNEFVNDPRNRGVELTDEQLAELAQ